MSPTKEGFLLSRVLAHDPWVFVARGTLTPEMVALKRDAQVDSPPLLSLYVLRAAVMATFALPATAFPDARGPCLWRAVLDVLPPKYRRVVVPKAREEAQHGRRVLDACEAMGWLARITNFHTVPPVAQDTRPGKERRRDWELRLLHTALGFDETTPCQGLHAVGIDTTTWHTWVPVPVVRHAFQLRESAALTEQLTWLQDAAGCERYGGCWLPQTPSILWTLSLYMDWPLAAALAVFMREVVGATLRHGVYRPEANHEPPVGTELDALERREQGRDIMNAVFPGLGDALATHEPDDNGTDA